MIPVSFIQSGFYRKREYKAHVALAIPISPLLAWRVLIITTLWVGHGYNAFAGMEEISHDPAEHSYH